MEESMHHMIIVIGLTHFPIVDVHLLL